MTVSIPAIAQIASQVCVVQTYAVATGRDPIVSHYEIHLASVDDPRAPHQSGRCRCLITVTRDPDLYARALVAEGDLTCRFDATWRVGRRVDGRPCQVLEQLADGVARRQAS